MQRALAVDGPLTVVADGRPRGWQGAPAVSGPWRDANGPAGPVAHRQPLMMDSELSPSNDLMARRRLVAP